MQLTFLSQFLQGIHNIRPKINWRVNPLTQRVHDWTAISHWDEYSAGHLESPWPSLSTDQLRCERLLGKDPAACEIKTKYARRHRLKAGNYSTLTQLSLGKDWSIVTFIFCTWRRYILMLVPFPIIFSALIGHTEENERILRYISLSFTVDCAKRPANKR